MRATRPSTDTSVALADVVVVVEATQRGGTRITADCSLDYGRPVLVVPGSHRGLQLDAESAVDGRREPLDREDSLGCVDRGMPVGAVVERAG